MTVSTACYMLAHRSCLDRTSCNCDCHLQARLTPARPALTAWTAAALLRAGRGDVGPACGEAGRRGLRSGVNGDLSYPAPKVRPARHLQPSRNGSGQHGDITAASAA